MKKLKLRGAYFAALAGAIAGAAIGIPAWAASSGGDSSGRVSASRPAPPRFAHAGFAVGFAGGPSKAEAKQMRAQMQKFASCAREHGADVPGVRQHGASITIGPPSAKARATMGRLAKECGVPPPPPPGKLFPLSAKQIEKNRKAMGKAPGKCLPLPAALPRRK
jgi:hypothetical protein